MRSSFSEQELARVRDAVSRAERQTSGEIVPFIVEQSDRYDVAVWRGASIAAVLAMGLVALTYAVYHGWGLAWLYTGWGVATVALGAGMVGALVGAYIPALKRQLAGAALMDRMVHHRAMRAFVEEEVFNTRDRTGILLFISMLEHRIEVLGDAGINQKVTVEDWADVVVDIRTGIVENHFVDGLVRAIDRCGELLDRKGVAIQSGDTNELSDDIRFSEGG
jgi:putative membrane protein